MRRTLVLDAEDLVMVVKEDVVKQIDENRGEMNRTEFVNYLIQCQLRDGSQQQNYVSKEEYQHFCQQITDLMRGFLEFFVSYGMALNRRPHTDDFSSLREQLRFLDKPGDENSGR
jgi:hypothetical protein